MPTFMNSVFRKALMTLTGIVMLWFLTAHMLGNTLILHGPGDINAYSSGLHILPTFLLGVRLALLVILLLHVFLGVMLTLENWKANPQKYAVKRMVKATFSGETMIWSGLLILSFLVYHLLHFTFRVVPGVAEATDPQGRFDVFNMVVKALRSGTIALVYLAAMGVLFLHLSHGVQSIYQTIGMNNEKAMPWVVVIGKAVAVFFLVGYGVIPVLILAGIGVFAK
ncbi:MAG: succinate dehydrogenase (or fumarate reductase) cytochrome b subunit, b558 family [Deltaproteobacteria bacterium]|nr:succinate dehydrogenase (or fumarate reductase) cytochrome b subunit, b558 family [Deltaproteobacteria bacterium]